MYKYQDELKNNEALSSECCLGTSMFLIKLRDRTLRTKFKKSLTAESS